VVSVDKIVQKLVRKYKTSCPFELAKCLNINVRYLDMPDGVRGFYYRVLRRRFIAINCNYSEEWQRFVCAHEIGHDRLHKGIGYYFIEQKTLFNPGKFERQANEFAIRLLTAGDQPRPDETLHYFYARNCVPIEMVHKI
jgi:Zn-dependent peptidase ImmA (M78 family)